MAVKIMGYPVKQSQKTIVTKDKNDTNQFVASIEMGGANGISITLPMQNQLNMDLREGQEIYLKVPTDSCIMEFKTLVRSFSNDNVPLVNLDKPADFKRIQRRKSFRLKTLINVKIAPTPEDPDGNPNYSPATGLDISAGGMEVMTSTPFQKDTVLMMKFDLWVDKKTVHTFFLNAEIRRVALASPGNYKLGLEFLNLTKSDTDKIYQFIFKKSAEKEFWKK